MEFDDSSEKLRRNLIVFCFGCLGSAYLGVSLMDLLEIVGLKNALSKVSQFRLNIILLIVLLYLAFRWFTSKPYLTLSGQFINWWRGRYKSRAGQMHVQAISTLPQRPPQCIKISDEGLSQVVEWYKEAEMAKLRGFEPKSAIAPILKFSRTHEGLLRLHLENGRGITDLLEVPYVLVVPLGRAIWFCLLNAWDAMKAQDFYEFLPPIVLALCTEFLLVFRLVVLIRDL